MRSERASFVFGPIWRLWQQKQQWPECEVIQSIIGYAWTPQVALPELDVTLVDGGSLSLLTPNASSLNYRLLRTWSGTAQKTTRVRSKSRPVLCERAGSNLLKPLLFNHNLSRRALDHRAKNLESDQGRSRHADDAIY